MTIYLDWDKKPAVLVDGGGRAFAIVDPAEGWREVEPAPVAEAGFLVSRGSLERLYADLLQTAPLGSVLAEAGGGSMRT
ncbi:MAG: hypothetical protein KDG89_17015 [Geminicoccaceae bacterium]|nr:hypothetical protein [Geminicoccaceae bacterium]